MSKRSVLDSWVGCKKNENVFSKLIGIDSVDDEMWDSWLVVDRYR